MTTLDAGRPPLATGPCQPTYTLELYGHPAPPGRAPELALSVHDSVPAALTPEDARRLAAALLLGARTVEQHLTETCPHCSRRVEPDELDDEWGGICVRCTVTIRATRRRNLSLVPLDPA